MLRKPKLGIGTKICVLSSCLIVVTCALTWWKVQSGGEGVLIAHELIDLDDDTHLAGRSLLSDIQALREDARSLARLVGRGLADGDTRAAVDGRLESFLADRRSAGVGPARGTRSDYAGASYAEVEGGASIGTVEFRESLGLGPQCVLLSKPASGSHQIHAHVPVYPDGEGRPRGVARLTLDLTPKVDALVINPRSVVFLADEAGMLLAASPDLALIDGGRVRQLADFPDLQPYSDRERSHADMFTPDGTKGGLLEQEHRLEATGYHSTFRQRPGMLLLAVDIDKPADVLRRPSERQLVELQGFLDDFNIKFGSRLVSSHSLADSYPDFYPYAYVRAAAEDADVLARLERELRSHPDLKVFARPRGVSRCDEFDVRFVKLHYDPDNPGRFLALGVGMSESEIRGDFRKEASPYLMIALILAAGIAGTFLFSRVFTGPLERMTRAAENFAEGRFEAGLPVRRRDEIGVLARAFDIMGRQVRARADELRASAARTQMILDMAAEGIVTVAQDGRIESYNKAAERILGYGAREVVGKHVDVLQPLAACGGERPELSRLVALARDSPEAITDTAHVMTGRRKDGSEFPMEVSVGVVDLGDQTLVTSIVRDVTERRRDELALRSSEERQRRLNEELDRRVRERTAELEGAKAELERSNQELSAARDTTESAMKAQALFFDQVAHDLRTPLTNVIGYSEDLFARATLLGLDDFIPDLRLVVNQGEFLGELISDLLNVSKAMSGKELALNLSEFDVAQMLRARLPSIDHFAERNGNRVVTDFADDLGAIVADEIRVWRILMNLLTNACKFTEGGTIRVSARREAGPSGGAVVFRVADTGIGMTSDQVARLFNRFVQVHSGSSVMGFGLGLSTCELYCRAMHGEIRVQSEPGEGSTFTVRIPVDVRRAGTESEIAPWPRRAHIPESTGAEAIPAGEKELVLIIDDDAFACELLRRNLADQGFRTRIATSGEEGLRLAKQILPAAILLDVVMPGINGWAVLAALKADTATALIPTIVVTMVDDQARGFALGADDFATKPLGRDHLAELLRKHLYRRPSGRVLVVEDDPHMRTHLVRLLKDQGFEVAAAGDGREAFDRIADGQPDLILLDLLLPGMDGFAVIERIRGDPATKAIPVIVLTGAEMDGERRRRLQGQVSQVLQKGSYGREELFREVRTLVAELHRQQSPDREVADAPNP